MAPVLGMVKCQANQGCHQGKSLKMPDESVGPQGEQSAPRDEKQKIETLPLDDQENAQEQNVFQKVKTAFQTVSNAESEEEVVNYDGHIKEAKEFGTKELECEGLKAMVPEGVQQSIDGGGITASATKSMNNSRAVTPLAEAEDDAIGTKQFSTVVEVEKLQTMMQGQNGQLSKETYEAKTKKSMAVERKLKKEKIQQTLEKLQCNISNDVRFQLLSDVANGMMSLKEMHKKLENLKKMSTLHKLIKNYLHLQTFSQCLEEFPDLLADDLLQKYLRFSLESIPDELKPLGLLTRMCHICSTLVGKQLPYLIYNGSIDDGIVMFRFLF